VLPDGGEGVVEGDRGDVHQPGFGRAAEQIVEDDVLRVGGPSIVDGPDVPQDIAGIGIAVIVDVRMEGGAASESEAYGHCESPTGRLPPAPPEGASRFRGSVLHSRSAEPSPDR